MNVEVPPSLLEDSDKETRIDSLYFIIRVLRNGARGYKNPMVSSEPSPLVHDLAERAISEIEASEKVPIRDLGKDRAAAYISLFEELQRTSYQHAVGEDRARAAEILAEMRESG